LVTAIALTFAAVILTVNRILPVYSTTASAFRRSPSEPRFENGSARSGSERNIGSSELIDPRLKSVELQLTESKQYEGSGRNIFCATVDFPARRKSRIAAPVSPPPSKPDTSSPPAIRLKFFGFASSPHVVRKVFLFQDGEIFVASEGDIVDRRYRIVRIDSESVDVEDLIENLRRTLLLHEG
jgi:hypothetical protein